MRTLISGGTLVSSTGVQVAEVLVEDERIVALAAPGSEMVAAFAEGARRIDASGRLVVPGAVDVHTHMEMPFGGTSVIGHLRDGHPSCRLGRDDHHRGFRRPA